jgi:hypothetical protein
MTAAILMLRPATMPGNSAASSHAAVLVRPFTLDCLTPSRPRLVWRWQRLSTGRLVGVWQMEATWPGLSQMGAIHGRG